jgi:iron complex transport system substrate-binding protein
VSRADAPGLRYRPGWQHIAALRTGRICALDTDQMNVLMRAGPRLGDAAHLLVSCLQGTLGAGGTGR